MLSRPTLNGGNLPFCAERVPSGGIGSSMLLCDPRMGSGQPGCRSCGKGFNSKASSPRGRANFRGTTPDSTARGFTWEYLHAGRRHPHPIVNLP
jgi:hypothetical protein